VRRGSDARLAVRLTPADVLIALYVGGLLVVLLGIARDYLALRHLTRKASMVSEASWSSLLDTVARRANVRGEVRLLRTRAAVMPLTAGVIRPVVIIPTDADAWPTETREAVLLHELAHVARRDCLTQTIAAIGCALYWPHPLIWLAAARLRVERELACDDAVIAGGVRPRDYASWLLELARALSAPLPRLAVSMAGVRELEDRLRSLIDESRRRRAPGRGRTVITTVGACAAALLLAVARPTAGVAAPPLQASRAPAGAEPSAGTFAVRLTTPDDGAERRGLAHVMLMTPGLNTFYIDLRDLEGLSRDQLTTPGTRVQFTLRRAAGSFDFKGVVRQGSAQGSFTFTADSSFNRALAKHGIRSVTADQQFSLARHGLSLEYIDELRKEGYATPSPAELVNAAMSGADLSYTRQMNALGYRMRTLGSLIALSNEGVGPALVRQLSAMGYRRLPVSDLIRLQNESIDSTFIARANQRAGRVLRVDELLLLRLGGDASAPTSDPSAPPTSQDAAALPPMADDPVVNGKWALQWNADRTLRLDIEWANVNQWRRTIRVEDLSDVTAAELTQGFSDRNFRIVEEAGVFTFSGSFDGASGSGTFTFAPNVDFAATLRSLGVREADRIGIHQLKNLAFGFISAEAVRGFMDAGLTPLTLRELVDLSVYQVTPEFAREVKARGETDLTARRLIDLWFTRRTLRRS
jgi:beta-lactamase regulating signal transducer with metallopeptidase domain